MKYKVIYGAWFSTDYSDGFTRQVDKALADGWRPQGGVAVDASGQIFYQAMILEAKEGADG